MIKKIALILLTSITSINVSVAMIVNGPDATVRCNFNDGTFWEVEVTSSDASNLQVVRCLTEGGYVVDGESPHHT